MMLITKPGVMTGLANILDLWAKLVKEFGMEKGRSIHLKTPTAPGSSIIDKGNSRGYLSQRFAKARSKMQLQSVGCR